MFNSSKINELIFYVYLLKNPVSKDIFYVGMGHNKRHLQHFKTFKLNVKKLMNGHKPFITNRFLDEEFKQIYSLNLEPIYEIILEKVCVFKALDVETKMIEDLGRRIDKSGILCNIQKDSQISPMLDPLIVARCIERKKLSFESNPEYYRNRLSEAAKLYFSNFENRLFGDKNPMFGKQRSLEAIEKTINSLTLYWSSEENKKKRSEININTWSNYTNEKRLEIVTKRAKSRKRKIICFLPDLSFIKVFDSYLKASDEMNLEKTNISAAARRISSNCGRYIWRPYDLKLLLYLEKRQSEKSPILYRLEMNNKIILLEDI